MLSCTCTLSQSLQQTQKISQLIEIVNLLKIPDEVLGAVASSIVFNPETVESFLVKRKEERKQNQEGYENPSGKIQAIYPSIYTPTIDTSKTRGGVIISPDLGGLEETFVFRSCTITPDVTYIGRKNLKPELVFADHLKSGMGLFPFQMNVNASLYPETARLVKQITHFDNWKRRILRGAYTIFGEHHREYFENLDKTQLVKLTQADLGEKLGVHEVTVSRVLENRFVEARGIDMGPEFLRAKDLIIDKFDIQRYDVIPRLNAAMEEEVRTGVIYSDDDLKKLVSGHVARRTVAKYRDQAKIPNHRERKIAYQLGRQEPFLFS